MRNELLEFESPGVFDVHSVGKDHQLGRFHLALAALNKLGIFEMGR